MACGAEVRRIGRGLEACGAEVRRAGRSFFCGEEARRRRGGAGAADEMEPQLGLHELLHVFSFLEARDLLCVAQVDKVVRPGGRQG